MNFDDIWEMILSFEGKEFKTVTQLPFTYVVKGKGIKPSRANQILSKSNFKKAFDHGPINNLRDIEKSVRGQSYVFAILNDARVK